MPDISWIILKVCIYGFNNSKDYTFVTVMKTNWEYNISRLQYVHVDWSLANFPPLKESHKPSSYLFLPILWETHYWSYQSILVVGMSW